MARVLIGNIEKMDRVGPKLAVGCVTDSVRKWWPDRFPQVPESVVEFMGG